MVVERSSPLLEMVYTRRDRHPTNHTNDLEPPPEVGSEGEGSDLDSEQRLTLAVGSEGCSTEPGGGGILGRANR